MRRTPKRTVAVPRATHDAASPLPPMTGLEPRPPRRENRIDAWPRFRGGSRVDDRVLPRVWRGGWILCSSRRTVQSRGRSSSGDRRGHDGRLDRAPGNRARIGCFVARSSVTSCPRRPGVLRPQRMCLRCRAADRRGTCRRPPGSRWVRAASHAHRPLSPRARLQSARGRQPHRRGASLPRDSVAAQHDRPCRCRASCPPAAASDRGCCWQGGLWRPLSAAP